MGAIAGAPSAPAVTANATAAPAFHVRTAQGGTVTVPSPDGKPTVLLFGAATDCASCAISEQGMHQVYGQYGHRAQFVTVDVNPGDSAADALAFARQFGGPWPHVLAQGTNLLDLYHVTSLDTMVVINGQGRLVARSDSGFSSQQLTALLQSAISGQTGASA